VEQEYTHSDERVWAAKWFQVKVDFRRRRAGDEQKPLMYDLKPAEDLNHGFREGSEAGISDDSEDQIEIAEIIGLRDPEDDAGEDYSVVSFDERPYAKEMEGIEWNTYEKYWSYFEAQKE
jgi:hypothetical protein